MTNLIESGLATRLLGAELLACDRAQLDARCSDSRSRCEHCIEPVRECACFPGMCRGGDVVNGLLANGDACKACRARLIDSADDTAGGQED